MTIPADFFTAPLASVDMHKVLNMAIEMNEDIVSDQITNQLDKGEDGKGASLGEYANYEYKSRWSPVDLRLTGDFRNSIQPTTYPDYFEMTATDPKTEELTQKYGDDILNMTKESIENTAEFIKDDVQKLFAEEVLK